MARVAKATEDKAAKQAQEKNQKLEAFEAALKMVNKELETETGTLIAKLGDRPMEVQTISTGSVVLDSITGGGFPRGRLIEIYGQEASGKTSIALTAVGNVQREGGNAVFVDLENALDPKYARKLGVDTNALAVSQPDYAEQAMNLVYRLTNSGTVDIIVVDSIASMIPKAELEGDMEQQTIGLLARLMSKGLRQLASAANKTGTTILFINQTRDAIGGFSPMGTPQTTPGGKAMKFYASQRIEVKKTVKVEEKTSNGKEIVGNEVRMTVRKNKIAPPFGVGTTVLTFGRGIDRAGEMITVGPEYGVILKPNNRTYIEAATGEVIGTSRADATEKLQKDKVMLERLQVELKRVINDDLFKESDEMEVLVESDPENKDTQDILLPEDSEAVAAPLDLESEDA